MKLKRGQKVDITKNNLVQRGKIYIKWQSVKEMDVDISAFLLHPGDRCVEDEHFIFYGQPQGIDGAVTHQSINHHEELIDIAFQKIPADIEKIALALTIHEGDERDLRFRDIEEALLFIKDAETDEVLYEFSFKGQLEQETAIVIGELYRHNGEWKFNAVGSGFFGGLHALCKNFGIQVTSEIEEQKITAPAPAVIAEPKPRREEKIAPVTAFQQQVDRSGTDALPILLEKGQSISILKSSAVMATLEWINNKKELDLYCFYVLQTGEIGKVYYRHFGSPSSAPYITLDAGAKKTGTEKIVIHQPSKLKYVLFASYRPLSSGAYSFKKIEAKLVIDNQIGQHVTAALYENNRYAYWVAHTHLNFTKANEIVISQVECYSRPGSEKSPVLLEDGTFTMDKGPIERR